MNNNRDNNKNNPKEKILQGALKSLETFSINKINDIIRESEKEKLEYGIIFCSDTDIPPFGNITYPGLSVGKEYDIDIIDCIGKNK